MFEIALGAELAGLYYVPVSTHLLAPEVAYILRDCRARLVLTTSDKLATLPRGPDLVVATTDGAPGTVDYEAALSVQPAVPVPPRPVGRPVLYSSGTTGPPKAIVRPMAPPEARGLPAPVLPVLSALRLDETSVYLSNGPLYHAAPLGFSLHALSCGGTCIVPRRFDAERSLTLIARHRVSHSQWVPTMFVRLLALPEEARTRHDLSSMRRAVHAAAPCPAAVKAEMIAWWGPILAEYYAGSEGIGMTWIESDEWLAHPGSVGRAMAGRIHIADEDGRDLPAGEVGQIWFSGGPAFAYLNAPEKTRAAVNGKGWATYGDLGHLDPDGYLYISDRRSDLIVSGGVNVYPQEVEDVLAGHPAVADVAVVGVPDPEYGERVHAVVQIRPGHDGDGPHLLAYCRERLAGPKCPRSFGFAVAIPRTEMGKLLRRVVKENCRATPA